MRGAGNRLLGDLHPRLGKTRHGRKEYRGQDHGIRSDVRPRMGADVRADNASPRIRDDAPRRASPLQQDACSPHAAIGAEGPLPFASISAIARPHLLRWFWSVFVFVTQDVLQKECCYA